MTQPTILIIDDNAANLELYGEMVDLAGYGACLVDHPDQVAQAVSRCNPALILLDLTLPGRSGFQVMAELASMVRIPVLAQTALQRPTLEDELEKAGFSGLIVKPFILDSFLAALEWGLNGAPGGFKVFA